MMKRVIYLVTIVLVACSGGGDSDDNTTMSKEFINTIQEVEILGDGGSQQFDIKSNCSWSISKSAEWLGVTPTSGTNNETITLTAGRNTTGEERVTVLTIEGGKDLKKKVIVTQTKPADLTNTMDPDKDDNTPPS